MGLIAEFKEFLREYKVMGLAVAFIMAIAGTALVKSLVDNIVMPLITPMIPGGGWQTATWAIGPFVFGWGAFLAALINFVIIAFVIFLIAKFALREEKVTKK
jgi:large conductance mechanosensitive channel